MKDLARQITLTTLIDIKTGEFTAEGSKKAKEDVMKQMKDIIGIEQMYQKMLNPKGGGGGGGTNDRDTALDSILEKLRRTRKASIDAQGGMKELLRVLGGGKDIKVFDGLEQQLSDLKAPQEFIDFITSLDPSVKAVGDGALKTYVDIQLLDKGIVELTGKGKILQRAFKEGIIGDFESDLRRSTNGLIAQKAQFIELNLKIKDSALVAEMLSDAQFALALSSATTAAEVDRLTQAFIDNKAAQEALATAQNPLAAAQDKFSKIEAQINNFFAAAEAAVKGKYAKSILDAERQIALKQKAVEDAQKNVEAIQDTIDGIQSEINKKQVEIETQVTRELRVFEEQIESLEEVIAESFDKPIAVLQEESSDLANDLTLIDNAAEEIAERYDKQKETLEKILDINKNLIAQEKQRISLADALTSGDNFS